MKENHRVGGVLETLGAFVFGATAGSLLTLLYAPASGSVTRRRLAMQAKNLQRAAARQFGKTQRELITKAQRAQRVAKGWIAEHVPHSNGRHPIRRRAIRHAAAH